MCQLQARMSRSSWQGRLVKGVCESAVYDVSEGVHWCQIDFPETLSVAVSPEYFCQGCQAAMLCCCCSCCRGCCSCCCWPEASLRPCVRTGLRCCPLLRWCLLPSPNCIRHTNSHHLSVPSVTHSCCSAFGSASPA